MCSWVCMRMLDNSKAVNWFSDDKMKLFIMQLLPPYYDNKIYGDNHFLYLSRHETIPDELVSSLGS